MPRCLLVLLLLAVPVAGQDALDKKVTAAIELGCKALMKFQKRDGSFGKPVGQHALALLALLHSKVDPGHPAIRKALRPLRGDTKRVYALALRLMVVEHLREPGLAPMARRDSEMLLDHQAMNGGWDYEASGLRTDNSCTQYAILGLRAADNLGLQVPLTAWRQAARFLGGQQQRNGGMGYTRERDPTASMTTGAVSSLVAVKARVSYKESDRRFGRLKRGVERGTKWLEKNWQPGKDPYGYYTLYGLERGMAFSGQDRLGARDWYGEGARWLLKRQRSDGWWVAANDVNNTAFALLFLSRASRATGAETPGSVHEIMGALGSQSNSKAIEGSAVALARKGKTAIPLLVHYLSDSKKARRRAAIQALRRITGSTRGYDEKLSPELNADAIQAWRDTLK